MQRELKHVEIGEMPQVRRLAEQVAMTGELQVLARNGQPVAMLVPVPTSAAEPEQHSKPTGRRTTSGDDSILGIIGLISSDGPNDVSTNKKKYLAEYYYSKSHNTDE